VSPLELRPGTEVQKGHAWTIAINSNQNLLGKTILVLNRPCESVAELHADEWSDLQTQIRRVQAALTALFDPDQFNYAFLMNADRQVHLHVIPRYRENRQWCDQSFDDPHWGAVFGSERRLLEGSELSVLRDALRANMPA
jgi:diadenosine tetraphosphate (Ap4A) HIT family hydrolase